MFAVSDAFLPTRTLNTIVCADGVNVSVPSKTIFSPSSKSKTSSSKKDDQNVLDYLVLVVFPR